MNAKRVNTAAGVIFAALQQDRTAAGIATALESAQLLQSPETAAELASLRARLAGELASPLAWARLLDAKSADNFMIALGMAADTDPVDGAISQVEEMIRSFRAALPAGAEEAREQSLHDHIVARDGEIERLEALLAVATEFRLWEPGYGLYVRRAPGSDGFGVLEANRTSAGRRAWTTAGWQYSAVLSHEELFCWPDAEVALAEARRIMPGAVVHDEPAEAGEAS